MKIPDNGYYDYWYYEMGVNIIPFDSINKNTNISWSHYQNTSLQKDQFERWKNNGSFEKGIAIITGYIWRGKHRGKYLACIDIDNKKGIEEFLSNFGKVDSLKKLAEKTIVEQHMDDANKSHIYFIVEKPLSKKSGLIVIRKLDKKENQNQKYGEEIPAIEVKSQGTHGTMIVTPSIHKNGHPYEIIGTKVPTVLDEVDSVLLEECLNQIYAKYQTNSTENFSRDGLTPIKDLFKLNFEIHEGNNRHETLLRVMESFIQRFNGLVTEKEVKKYAISWNNIHCKPPLDDKEFEKQWQDAKKFMSKKSLFNEDGYEKENEDSEIAFLKYIKERYIDIFYDQLNKLFVTIKINNHVETLPLESKRFKQLIRKELFEKENKIINDDKLDRIVKTLQAEMMFDENIKRIELSLRVAGNNDLCNNDNNKNKDNEPKENRIFYYDLTNPVWEIIKISSEGWDIVKNNILPLFKRYENNSVPQVYPVKSNANEIYFKQFLKLLNVKTNDDLLLLSVYIISLFIPDISKPIIIIRGSGGGAKTTILSFIKNIVDPGTTDTVSFSQNKDDLIQTLEHSYVVYFDNVSYISEGVSNNLCRAVTGSGNEKRELYTTDGVFVYKFKRCIGINGISLVTTKADLIDRSIILKVDRIPDEKRIKEEEIKKEVKKLKPYVLGHIFDILVNVLKYRQEHDHKHLLKNLPRMADFAEWGEIISRCLGYSDNEFINAYQKNIDKQNDEVIESTPVAEVLITFMENKDEWIGTPTELYRLLNDIVIQIDSNIRRTNYWPKASNRLTSKINEIIPNLLKKGLEVITGEKNSEGKRVIKLTKIKQISQSTEIQPKTYGNTNNDEHSSISNSSSLDVNLFVHRKGGSDYFECENCSLTGDIHFMKQHKCGGN